MGKHGVGTMNENGNLFVELCGNHSLKIGGTLFPHKECHKNTWCSNDHVTTAQLDHVCISSGWSKALLDVRVFRRADIGSDHHMLCASLRLDFTRIYRKKTPSPRRAILVALHRKDKSMRTGRTSKGSSQTSHKKFSATRKISGKTTSATKPGKSSRKGSEDQ